LATIDLDLNWERTDGPLRRVLDAGFFPVFLDRYLLDPHNPHSLLDLNNPPGGVQVRPRWAWQDRGRVLLRLGPGLPDLEVVWAGALDGETAYFVLEQEPFDLDDERWVQYVVRADIPGAVRTLDAGALSSVERALREAARAAPEVDVALVERQFGPIVERGSDVWYRACLADLRLVPGLHVMNYTVSPSTVVPTRALAQVNHHLVVTLVSPGHPGCSEEYRVVDCIDEPVRDGPAEGFLQGPPGAHGQPHVALRPRDPRGNDPSSGGVYLVEARPGAIAVLDGEAFQRPARALVDRRTGGRGNCGAKLASSLSYSDHDRVATLLAPRRAG
jgi:hypothetical protein